MKESVFDKILRQMRLRQIVPHLREFDNPRVLDVGCGWEARLLRQIEPFIAKGVGIDFKAPEIETEKLSVFSYVFEVKKGANSHEANSSLGNHCIDLAFHHKARTPSPLTLCQNTKNSTSKTASRRLDKRSEVPNTRILGESMGDSAKDSGDSAESSHHCEHSQNVKQSIKNANFVNDAESFVESAESLKDSSDSKATMDCHDSATQNLAMTAKGDSTDSSDSVESTKDSNVMDCHEAKASRNDDSGAVSSNSITSRNDASLSSLRGQRPKQSIKTANFIKTTELQKDSNIMDCLVPNGLRNDERGINCHDLTSSSLAMTKNDAFKASRNDASAVDSHDFIPQNLALPSNKVANAIIGIGGGI